ncbi:C40 family peptidase [Bacillus sp. FJAT-45350]|uniref:C40 family peptidase n=1 Tax=Bacillus sp. FJAT-45350 TaxID=2011014 RepID=UPI000BB6F853|nr:C40 family peptidase [Bacillus sp. FJAT-45350]
MSRKKLTIVLVFTMIVSILSNLQTTYASTTDTIVANAKKHIGVPYRFGGTTPNGFDCSGFILYTFKQAGITLPRTATEQYNTGMAVKKSELTPGDLVFFETYKPGPSHSGIYVGDNQFIHASSSRGITISSINDPHYWGPRYLGAKRVLEEEKGQAVEEEKTHHILATLPVGQFHDVARDHWAVAEIRELSTRGIINGFEQQLFKPNELVTRAQAAVMLATSLGLETDDYTSLLNDISNDHWAAGSIKAVTDAGYFGGLVTDSFKPSQALTREEVAYLIATAFELQNESTSITFTDIDPSHWAYEEVNGLVSSGVISGFPDNTYRPSEDVTRAQFAKILHSALN